MVTSSARDAARMSLRRYQKGGRRKQVKTRVKAGGYLMNHTETLVRATPRQRACVMGLRPGVPGGGSRGREDGLATLCPTGLTPAPCAGHPKTPRGWQLKMAHNCLVLRHARSGCSVWYHLCRAWSCSSVAVAVTSSSCTWAHQRLSATASSRGTPWIVASSSG